MNQPVYHMYQFFYERYKTASFLKPSVTSAWRLLHCSHQSFWESHHQCQHCGTQDYRYHPSYLTTDTRHRWRKLIVIPFIRKDRVMYNILSVILAFESVDEPVPLHQLVDYMWIMCWKHLSVRHSLMWLFSVPRQLTDYAGLGNAQHICSLSFWRSFRPFHLIYYTWLDASWIMKIWISREMYDMILFSHTETIWLSMKRKLTRYRQ